MGQLLKFNTENEDLSDGQNNFPKFEIVSLRSQNRLVTYRLKYQMCFMIVSRQFKKLVKVFLAVFQKLNFQNMNIKKIKV